MGMIVWIDVDDLKPSMAKNLNNDSFTGKEIILFFNHIGQVDFVMIPHYSNITVASQWARLRPKSPASWLFAQPFIQAQIKEYTNAPRHWPLCGEFTGSSALVIRQLGWIGKPVRVVW